MKNEHDMDLMRLFAESRELAHDEIFVERVSKRIVLLRRVHRVMQTILAFAGAAILAALTPYLMDLTGYIALGSNLIADNVAAVLLSPAGWAIGGGAGLFFFLRTRS